MIATRLASIQRDLAARLRDLENSPVVPFNRMSDWGEDGRIKPSAPVYSPVMRHRRELELE